MAEKSGKSHDVEQMLDELSKALDADQKQRAMGMEKTAGAARTLQEDDMLNKIERSSRDATRAAPPQPQPVPYPVPRPPPPMMPPPGPGKPPPGVAPPIGMAPAPMPAQPMPGQMPMPAPMPTPGSPPGGAMPMPIPAPQPMGQPTPEQLMLMQRQIYGG